MSLFSMDTGKKALKTSTEIVEDGLSSISADSQIVNASEPSISADENESKISGHNGKALYPLILLGLWVFIGGFISVRLKQHNSAR